MQLLSCQTMPTCWNRYSKSARCRNCGSDQRIPGQPSANWDIEIIDNENLPLNMLSIWRNAWGQEGGYVIYVGSLTVPQHNLWADLLVKYQKEHYPDMHEVTRRMPVAESVDDSRRTTLDLMKNLS